MLIDNLQGVDIPKPEVPRARYLLAKAWQRICARIIDMAIVIAISFAFGVLICATSKAVSGGNGLKDVLNLKQTWRYFMIAAISAFISISYFLVLPYITKGRTVGLIIFKLRIYNLIATKNFFRNLMKREFFLWMVVVLANLVLGITLWAQGQPKANETLTDLLKMQGNGNNGLTAMFYTFYAIGALLLIFVVIHMSVFNKRRCFIDRISDTVVIKMVDVSSKDPSSNLNTGIKKSKRNYGLPGEIIGSPADEIDGL